MQIAWRRWEKSTGIKVGKCKGKIRLVTLGVLHGELLLK
jgi:hypothetical protein